MTTAEDKRAATHYRVRRMLQVLSVEQLRDVIDVERETGYAHGIVAEMARDELAKRCEQA